MDRFKFRIWHKKRKKMYEVLHLHTATWSNGGDWVTAKGFNIITQQDMHIQIEPKDGIIMQCTGLKDKNGKLIYEGDVVKEEGSCFSWEVAWNTDINYQWMLRRIEPDSIYPHIITFSSLLSWKKYEVIGNIYENKDLLNE